MDKRTFVMVLDNEQTILTMLSRVMGLERGDITENDSGSRILSLLGGSTPNLVALDIEIPDLDTASDLDGRSTPVIMLKGTCELTTLDNLQILRKLN